MGGREIRQDRRSSLWEEKEILAEEFAGEAVRLTLGLRIGVQQGLNSVSGGAHRG